MCIGSKGEEACLDISGKIRRRASVTEDYRGLIVVFIRQQEDTPRTGNTFKGIGILEKTIK